jgi:ABC-type multidrug transport system ATPase subunit
VLFPTLTCEESIEFAGRLRTNTKGAELKEKVNNVIHDLGLAKCRNTFIGSQTLKGLSGGERKRTAIGVELICNPSILMLDEPTSGLDSFTARKIVDLLVKQSRMGKTVIATIHQPSSQTFALFDKLLLLMDGHVIYQGLAKD